MGGLAQLAEAAQGLRVEVWGPPGESLASGRASMYKDDCAQSVGDQSRRDGKAEKTTMRKPGWNPGVGIAISVIITPVSPLGSQSAS